MIVSFFPLTVSVAALEYANNISNLDRSCDQISHITLEPQMSALYKNNLKTVTQGHSVF